MSTLMGPGAEEAYVVIESALTMTREQAISLSRAYEADPNEHYIAHCTVVQDALEITGRTVSPEWFGSVFRYQDWTVDTKALHAVADIVMALLVADVVPTEVIHSLSRPWISHMVQRQARQRALVAGPV